MGRTYSICIIISFFLCDRVWSDPVNNKGYNCFCLVMASNSSHLMIFFFLSSAANLVLSVQEQPWLARPSTTLPTNKLRKLRLKGKDYRKGGDGLRGKNVMEASRVKNKDLKRTNK